VINIVLSSGSYSFRAHLDGIVTADTIPVAANEVWIGELVFAAPDKVFILG
jgi:hypothetical protein